MKQRIKILRSSPIEPSMVRFEGMPFQFTPKSLKVKKKGRAFLLVNQNLYVTLSICVIKIIRQDKHDLSRHEVVTM